MDKTSGRSWRVVGLSLCALALQAAQCPQIVRRGGAVYDGSARWAWDKAQPVAAQTAADAELRQILGDVIQTDGRLPANQGSWSFVYWSPGQTKTVQITIAADGTLSTTLRVEAAPGPGVQRPLPAGWANSTEVFQSIVSSGVSVAGASQANLAVLNIASYANAPNQAAWAINFDGNVRNQVVRWDGTYAGPQ